MANDLEVLLKVREQGLETFDRATSAIKGLVSAYIGIAGAQRFIRFSIDAAKAADEEAKSSRKLINALKEKNLYTEQSYALYKDFAQKQMFIIGKENEEIEAVQTLLIQYGVYGPLVNKTTEAIIDLAAATSIDLSTATNLVLRGLETEKGGLKGITSHLDGAAGSAERLVSIYDVLMGKFKGSGKAAASELDILDLKYKEMQEEWGKKTLPIYIKVMQAGLESFDPNFYATWADKITMGAASALGKAWANSKWFGGTPLNQAALDQIKRQQVLKEGGYQAIEGPKAKEDLGGITKRPLSEEEQKKIENRAIELDQFRFDAHQQYLKALAESDKKAGEKRKKEMDADLELSQWLYDRKTERLQKYYDRQEKLLKKSIETQRQAAIAIGTAMAVGLGQGAQGFKESAKAVLVTVIDLMEKKAQAMILIQTLWDWSALAKLAIVTFAFEALKKGVQSFATGTTYAPGGWSMVGERGPELMNVPRGSQIYNNQQTRNTTTNNKPTVNLYITGGGGNLRTQLENGVRSKEIDLNRLLQTAGIRV